MTGQGGARQKTSTDVKISVDSMRAYHQNSGLTHPLTGSAKVLDKGVVRRDTQAANGGRL